MPSCLQRPACLYISTEGLNTMSGGATDSTLDERNIFGVEEQLPSALGS